MYIYNNKKANMNVINQHLDKENNVFTNNSKTNSIQESWEEFKLIRKTVNSKLDASDQNYISQLLEIDEDGE
jgi:hemerythrin-like domain-containing protein